MKSQLQILILSEDYPAYPGGIAQWARGMATGLGSIPGVTIRVLYRPRKEFGAVSDSGIQLVPIEGSRWKQFRTWICRKAVRKTISEGFKPDYVVATTWNVARGLTGLQKKSGFKLVLIVHGLEVTRPMPALKKWWLRETLDSVFHVISVSQFTKDRLIRNFGVPDDKISVLPNGVSPQLFLPSDAVKEVKSKWNPTGMPLMLTFARVIERKGHDQVIRALPDLIRQTGPVTYLIAGTGDEEWIIKLRQLAQSLNVAEYVQFTGYVSDHERPAMYQIADVYVMISREIAGDTEGFGITYLEANACGIPVVAGDSGGVRDAVEDDVTGLLVPPQDITALVVALTRLLKNPEERHKLGENGRNRVQKELTWGKIAIRFLELCNRK